jgi:hypothetical protein
VEHEDPAQHTDLVRRQACPVRVAHQLLHALDEPDEILVEPLDVARGHAQNRIGVLPDLRERSLAQRFPLRVELFVSYLSCLLGHGVNVIRGPEDRRRRLR